MFSVIPLLIFAGTSGLMTPSEDAASNHLHPQDGPHADVRITFTDEGVVMTITMNLVFMDYLVATPRESMEALHPLEEEGVCRTLAGYFKTENSVSIDGVRVPPVVKSFEVIRPSDALLPLFPNSGNRGMVRCIISLLYPAKTSPKSVAFVWSEYPPDELVATEEFTPTLVLEAMLISKGIETLIRFSEEEPEYTWHDSGATLEDRFLAVPSPIAPKPPYRIPVFSIGAGFLWFVVAFVLLVRDRKLGLQRWVALGVPLTLFAAFFMRDLRPLEIEAASRKSVPDQPEALAIFAPLHNNIYRAFDYTGESDVYDALSQSVTGELLDSLYNQIYQSLIMHEEGGALSRVQEVRPIETSVQSIGAIPETQEVAFHVRARWQVDGMVYHWGHSHSRTNEYDAEYTVSSTEDGWRISGSKILEQFRVESEELGPTIHDHLPPGSDI